MRLLRAAAAVCIILGALAVGRPAAAHPLGNFTINHLAKVELRRDRLVVRYFLDFAEIPTFQITRSLDAQARPAQRQLDAWARSEIAVVQHGLIVRIDGRRTLLQAGDVAVRTRPGAGGLPILYWTAAFLTSPPARARDGAVSVSIVDDNYANRIGWKDIVVAPATEPTHELLRYPVALLSSPRDVTSVEIALRGARVTVMDIDRQQPIAPAGATSQIRSNHLSDMLARGTTNWAFVVLTLLVAVGLGALHALEPGHGKTLLAVSLVGARATAKQAVILASALTVAHTLGVILLGVALLFVANRFVPENIYPWITLASGAVVATFGATALARAIRARRGAASQEQRHHHHHHHDHDHSADRPLSFGGVVAAAATGNVAPCPAALVVLLTALTLHQLAYGLIVIVAFSIGLAAVLTGLGIGLVHGAALISRNPAFDRVARYGPMASAAVISLIGAVMLGQGLVARNPHASALAATVLALVAIAAFSLSAGRLKMTVGRLTAAATIR